MKLWVDVEDLFAYARHNPRPSGIQRLAFQIQQELRIYLADKHSLRFVRHEGRDSQPLLWEASWAEIEELFLQLTGPQNRSEGRAQSSRLPSFSPLVQLRHALGALAVRMPPRLGNPLLQSWSFQQEALHQFRVLARAVRLRASKSAPPRKAQTPPAPIASGDVFLVLGAPWIYPDFPGLLHALQVRHGVRTALLLYDLIPLLRPEWCANDLVRQFIPWLSGTLPLCDSLMAISRHTASEIEQWALRAGIRLNRPVQPVLMGSGFGADGVQAELRPPGLPRPKSYVLFVSTLEARKNHMLLLRVWRALLDEELAGRRPVGSVPQLVFAGRIGWLVSDLLQQLENASWLGGRVRLLRDPSDAELRALYGGCLFSIFPSLYEGWGLPVTEALALGVPVLCSSATALPEAGGEFARYFDPENAGECRRAVAALIDDPVALETWREDIRRRYRPTPWSATAQAVIAALPQDGCRRAIHDH